MNELNLDDFRYGGANITGFSIVDYYNHYTFHLLTDALQINEPINKINVIPVCDHVNFFLNKSLIDCVFSTKQH